MSSELDQVEQWFNDNVATPWNNFWASVLGPPTPTTEQQQPPPTMAAPGVAPTVQVAVSGTPSQGNVPLTVGFSATPTGGMAPYSYAWDFGDGTTDNSGGVVSHTYDSPGTYTVKCSVVDSQGNSGSGSQTVTAQAASTPGTTPPTTASTPLLNPSAPSPPQAQAPSTGLQASVDGYPDAGMASEYVTIKITGGTPNGNYVASIDGPTVQTNPSLPAGYASEEHPAVYSTPAYVSGAVGATVTEAPGGYFDQYGNGTVQFRAASDTGVDNFYGQADMVTITDRTTGKTITVPVTFPDVDLSTPPAYPNGPQTINGTTVTLTYIPQTVPPNTAVVNQYEVQWSGYKGTFYETQIRQKNFPYELSPGFGPLQDSIAQCYHGNRAACANVQTLLNQYPELQPWYAQYGG